jgi:hypothetical protein
VRSPSFGETIRYSSSITLDLSSLGYPRSKISYIIAGSASREVYLRRVHLLGSASRKVDYFTRTSGRVARSPSSVLGSFLGIVS